jgi:hypothetical protein
LGKLKLCLYPSSAFITKNRVIIWSILPSGNYGYAKQVRTFLRKQLRLLRSQPSRQVKNEAILLGGNFFFLSFSELFISLLTAAGFEASSQPPLGAALIGIFHNLNMYYTINIQEKLL